MNTQCTWHLASTWAQDDRRITVAVNPWGDALVRIEGAWHRAGQVKINHGSATPRRMIAVVASFLGSAAEYATKAKDPSDLHGFSPAIMDALWALRPGDEIAAALSGTDGEGRGVRIRTIPRATGPMKGAHMDDAVSLDVEEDAMGNWAMTPRGPYSAHAMRCGPYGEDGAPVNRYAEAFLQEGMQPLRDAQAAGAHLGIWTTTTNDGAAAWRWNLSEDEGIEGEGEE